MGKTGVAVAVERRETTAGAVRLAVVRRATTEELTSFARGAIDARKATVFTDAWQGYTALTRAPVLAPRSQSDGSSSDGELSRRVRMIGARAWLPG